MGGGGGGGGGGLANKLIVYNGWIVFSTLETDRYLAW